MPVHIDWKRSLCILTGCIVVIGISAIVTFFGFPPGINDIIVLKDLPDQDGIFFLGHLYQVNVQNRTVSVSWLVGGCGNFILQTAAKLPGSKCGLANVPINVYVNGESQFNYDPTVHPIGVPANKTLYVQALNEFQYKHTMDISTEDLRNNRAFEQQYFYPFEKYDLVTTFIGVNSATNTSLPIVRLVFSDTANNFSPWPEEEWETETYMNNTRMTSRATRVTIKRTVNAQTFVMLLFSLNWLLTFTVMYFTSIALWSKTELGDRILLLPMTLILTLPQLRQMFVDAPSFGVFLDSLGLIIQMMIVAICGVIMISCLSTKPKEPQKTFNLDFNLKDHDDSSIALLPYSK